MDRCAARASWSAGIITERIGAGEYVATMLVATSLVVGLLLYGVKYYALKHLSRSTLSSRLISSFNGLRFQNRLSEQSGRVPAGFMGSTVSSLLTIFSGNADANPHGGIR